MESIKKNMNKLEIVGIILGVILFTVIGFWWVNVINARDMQIIESYKGLL